MPNDQRARMNPRHPPAPSARARSTLPSDQQPRTDETRRLAFAVALVLVCVGVLWELVVAPISPGAWSLALKMLPLALGLPALLRGRLRAYQGWSMGVLPYVAEGGTRIMTDRGASAIAAAAELGLGLLLFGVILVHVRRVRTTRAASAAAAAAR